MRLRHALPVLAMAFCTHAAAQFAVENLIARMPEGYKVDHRGRAGSVALVMMVPQAESVKQWSEMLTTQTFLGTRTVELEPFMDDMRERGLAACKEVATFAAIGVGVENGYPFVMWSLGCPKSSNGQPEYSWYKAIKGNDSFYLVSRSFRKDPSTPEEEKLLDYFRTVTVCDPRLPAQSCPKG